MSNNHKFEAIRADMKLDSEALWRSPQGARRITVWCSNDYLGLAGADSATICKMENLIG